jgi:hypothetical protein
MLGFIVGHMLRGGLEMAFLGLMRELQVTP